MVLFLSIAAAFAADKDAAPFRPAPASAYEHRQTNSAVTIGVDPYNLEEKQKTAFGKVDLYRFGVLPVLVVIQNDSDKAIRLDNIEVQYVGPNGNHVEATPAKEIRYLNGPRRPDIVPGPTGQPKVGRSKKNPLDAWEVEGRAFAARMLPPGQTASGFFYFQTGLQRGATIYLNGLSEAGSNKELFYFEIPLE
ncbi:MAG: hypothetical protein C5B51_00645 [Terriglobia bacterium]|nr:MAG: hypothetical protein C5B51_00645 [Terriglobia bacterium]